MIVSQNDNYKRLQALKETVCAICGITTAQFDDKKNIKVPKVAMTLKVFCYLAKQFNPPIKNGDIAEFVNRDVSIVTKSSPVVHKYMHEKNSKKYTPYAFIPVALAEYGKMCNLK